MNDPTIMIFFHQDGDEPFIWQINGKITVNALIEIERDACEYSETLFDKGTGSYKFSVAREDGQYGPEGQCEFPPYWDLSFIEFEPYEMAGDMTDPIGHPME